MLYGRSSDLLSGFEPSRCQGINSGIFKSLQELTAAGTVADFHDIPFSPVSRTIRRCKCRRI